MSDTLESSTNSDSMQHDSTADENTIEELEDKVTEIKRKKENVEEKLIDVRSENRKYKQKLDRMSRENEKLKQSPLFVASVEDILSENEVVIRQHGNNQEAVTEVTREQFSELEPQDRVAVDNSLNIVKIISDEIDSRARMMQVTESPDVTYNDIGGVDEQLVEVREAIEKPLTEPELFENVGITPPNGVLLHGPPGTGKTLIAKAVANKTNASFIRLSGSDLARKFIGEGAQLVRDLFKAAREEEPCVVFIDEIDAIASKRVDSKTSGDAEVQRTLMQLLNELDGFEDRGEVSIIAATNRVDMLDDAILRPGRFDRLIEVAEPDVAGREQIFQIHTRGMSVGSDVDIEALAEMTSETTGAEIKSICTEAGMQAIRDSRSTVTREDFENAYSKLQETKENGSNAGMALPEGSRSAFA